VGQETNQRFKRILAAYKDAIGDGDPADVNVVDLLPAIFKAAPDAEVDDIVAALGWQGDRAMREAEALREYVATRGGPVVLPQGEMFPNACLLPHHKCSRPTRVQAYTLSALPPKQAARDARFPLRRSERAACVPLAF